MTEFARIFDPKAAKAVKAISMLTNGHRYAPTQEEKDHTLEVLKNAVNDIAQLYGMLPSGKAPVEIPADTTSEKRIAKNKDIIKRSAFAREDVYANVHSIPEAQLTAYASSILARLCAKFDDPEAQPKNFKPKEE